jgi:signal transduction histidine kinase
VMADGLLTFAKGTHEAEQPVVIDLAAFLQELSKNRGAIFREGAQARIKARPVALGRAIGNLVDNALRYGGSAAIRLETATGEARIVVEDDGPGIAAEKMEAMFEPFVRGEDSRNSETGGAGLGLSIARSIIQSHGGSVAIENKAPKGLRVIASLPLA